MYEIELHFETTITNEYIARLKPMSRNGDIQLEELLVDSFPIRKVVIKALS